MENGSFLTRRSFLGIAGGLPLAWAAASRLHAASGRKIPIAVQLYSVRGDCKQDFDKALEQVAAMGFAGVEFAGYYNYAGKGTELKKRLDALHLKAEGTHVQLSALEGDALKQTIEFHQAIGCPFLIVPGNPDFTDPEKSKALADTFNKIAETLKPLKMATGYHNHVNEFKNTDGGKTYWDLFAERTSKDDHPAAGLRLDDGRWVRPGRVHQEVPGADADDAFQGDCEGRGHREEGHPRPGFGGLGGRLRRVPVGRRYRLGRPRAGDLSRQPAGDGLHARVAGGVEEDYRLAVS